MLKDGKNKLLILFLLLFLFSGAIFIFTPLEISISNGINSLEISFLTGFAQRPLEIIYPEIPGANAPTTTKTVLPDYIRYVFQFSLFLGALISLGSFIYGGMRYLTSAGNPTKIKDAQSRITSGMLGLLLLLSAYIILNTINPQLVAFEVPPLEKASTGYLATGIEKDQPTTLLEIPLGGVVENLWGTKDEPKKADCYQFDENGDIITGSLGSYGRLQCIEWLSESIKIKAENLKKPAEELQKLYDCQNCCKNCCKNTSCDWIKCSEVCSWNEITQSWESCLASDCCAGTKNEGCWENCGSYSCCEGRGMTSQYNYQECPYSCCEFFEECPCTQCGFDCSGDIKTEEGENCNCICVKQDGEGNPVCCNPDDPEKPYEDVLVKTLVDKKLLETGEEDPYPDISDIKTALKELRIKIGFSSLTESLLNNVPVCCTEDDCLPEEKIGAMDCLLRDEETKNLIKELLIGEPPDEEKIKEILMIKPVMEYLVQGDRLSGEKNLAKTMMRAAGILKSEVAFNEVGWMGTEADPADEWIELYNNTTENIDLSDWKLVVKGKFEIELSGTIPAQGFFLLAKNGAISEPEVDLVFGGDLPDKGGILELYDEFGNVAESLDCSGGWFGGDEEFKASMERMDPQGCLNKENWSTNWSIKVAEEMKKDFINGKDREENLIYGTPKEPNSIGIEIIPSSFSSWVAELRNKLSEEKQREKLILVLRKKGSLERMLRTKEALIDILMGDDERLKEVLKQREVLRILLENEGNLTLLLSRENAKELIKNILGIKEEDEWEELIGNLPETRVNLKLINDFQRDLQWVLDAKDLMRKCEQEPISYDQLRTPETFFGEIKIEEIPEWEGIKKEANWIEGTDPSTFYCPESLW